MWRHLLDISEPLVVSSVLTVMILPIYDEVIHILSTCLSHMGV